MLFGQHNNNGMQSGKFLERAVLGDGPRLSDASEKLKEGDVEYARVRIRQNLDGYMNEVRRRQAPENDPSVPRKMFLKNVSLDVDEKIQEVLNNDERYEVRVYSAVGTVLDFAGGFDFWVELFDAKEERALANYKIDLTSNPNKRVPGQLADAVYFYDADLVEERGMEAIYDQEDYRLLVEGAARNLLQQVVEVKDEYH